MGVLRDIFGAFVDQPEHWGPLFLHSSFFKLWLPLCFTPLLLLGFHSFATLRPTLRRAYLLFVGVTITLFSGLYLIRAASNVVEPPEWDMLAFWTFGKVAAAGGNFYAPALFHDVALGHPQHEAFGDPLFVRDVLDVGFPYPPPSILLVAPLGFFDLRTATVLWYALQLIALVAAIVLLWQTFVEERGWLGTAVVAALVLTLHATYTTIALVQTNFLVLLLLTAFWREQTRARSGLYVGLGIVIKPFVGFVLLYLALRRQWSVLGTAIITIVVLCGLTAGLFGWEPFITYALTNPASNLPGWIYQIEPNQSLAAKYVRLISHDVSSGSPLIQPAYLAVATALGGLTVALAWLHRRGDPALAFGIMLPAALLLYPQSWSHYAVILVLPILLLSTERGRWHLTTAVAVTLISVVYALARDEGFPVSAALLMWLVFAALCIRAARPRVPCLESGIFDEVSTFQTRHRERGLAFAFPATRNAECDSILVEGGIAMKSAPQVLEPQCEWTSDQVADESLWTEVLTANELEEIDAALRQALVKSEDVLEIGCDDFPLPTLRARLDRIKHELIDGRGFVRLRGVDRSRYSQAEMEMLYWGIGMHLGAPWPQNKHGHVLGDVTDYGKSMSDPNTRGYEIGSMALPFHCDGSDLVGLMSLANGVSGGLSAVANSVTIHNRMVRETPDLAAELYKPQPYDFRGEQKPGSVPYYSLPVFTHWNGRLFVRCIPPYIFASQRHADAPRLTETAVAALQRLDELANDPVNHVRMELRPGDMQFINNYHVLHGRTAYEDDRTTGRIRHLKRLWLETDMLDNRPPYFAMNVSSHWNERRSASRMRLN